MDRQNPRTHGKSNGVRTKSHKEAYTYTLTKVKKENIYMYMKKKSKRPTKSINKSTDDSKL